MPPPPPPPPPPGPAGLAPITGPNGVSPLRLGGDIHVPTKLKDVPAAYPPGAREAGVQGVVILEAVIDGERQRQHRARAPDPYRSWIKRPSMRRQWQFTPTLLNGAPVPVVMTVTINFTLP